MRFSIAFAGTLAATFATIVGATNTDGTFNDDGAHTLLAWFPPITRPAGGEVFQAGSQQIASWNRQLPTGFNLTSVGKKADLMLGYTIPDVLSYHLEHTLVKDIMLYEGDAEVEYTLPTDLPTSDSYFLALVGSSSNVSPKFTIKGTQASTTETLAPAESKDLDLEDEGLRRMRKLKA
ncbi:uncharacterized protein JCM15063_000138 [Sporobolomyces koalae]|uniref:uncharacterized protein n=1 Tax=Sporobolomyces koalae TaxID=500713 RepID=UPI00316FED88